MGSFPRDPRLNAAKQELEGESLDKWKTCVEKIEDFGLEEEKAEKAVGQAFGWGKQSYWLKKKKNEVPNPENVSPYEEKS